MNLYKIMIKLRDVEVEDESQDTIEDEVTTEEPKKEPKKVQRKKVKPTEQTNDEIVLSKKDYEDLLSMKLSAEEKDVQIRKLTLEVNKMSTNLESVNSYVTSVKEREQLLEHKNSIMEFTTKLYEEKPYLKDVVNNYLTKKNVEKVNIEDINIFINAVEPELLDATKTKAYISNAQAVSKVIGQPNNIKKSQESKEGYVRSFLKDLNL